MTAADPVPQPTRPAEPAAAWRRKARRVGVRILLHVGCLLIAVGSFAAYAHFKIEGSFGASPRGWGLPG